MQERDFSIYDKARRLRITGGLLWQMEPRKDDQMWRLDREKKILRVYLHPNDDVNTVKEQLFELIREHNWRLHLYFAVQKRVPSLLLMVPASLTVWLICFGSLLGDAAIAVAFTEGAEDTIFGLSRFWLFMIMGALATLMLYSFPAFFSGEQEGFIQYIYNRFSQRSIIRERFRKAFNFLKARGWIEKIEVWNPPLTEGRADWVPQSLIPAILDANLGCELQIKVDERSAAQNFAARLTRRAADEIEWEENYFDLEADKAVPYEYLEGWEKRLLAIYTFASTANLPASLQPANGLQNVVSLGLVEIIVMRFKERLFAEEDREQLISLDTFASRCVNDLGVLSPATQFSRPGHELWQIEQSIINTELDSAREEMRYVFQYLETHFKEVSHKAADIVTALICNSLYAKVSTHSPKRLAAMRYFIQIVKETELYKIFNLYWPSIVAPPASQLNHSEDDVYRVLGVDYLIDLGILFEKAAMYQHAEAAYDFIEEVHPYKGTMGKARIAEKRGDYLGSTLSMLNIKAQAASGQISTNKTTNIDLNLNLAWAIVSGRLVAHQTAGLQALEEAKQLLYADFDQTRNSDQIVRLYNIIANYEEWAGRPLGSISNYENALRIPGAEQWGLSNILVNKGIALRQVGQLADGAKFGEQGVEIKTAIGDNDQLPIALHNLAQTYLMLAVSLPKDQQTHYFRNALRHAQTGIDIQNRTGSVKKRGQLLAERYIASLALIPEQTDTLAQLLQDVHNWLQKETYEGRENTYDFKVVSQELLPMSQQIA